MMNANSRDEDADGNIHDFKTDFEHICKRETARLNIVVALISRNDRQELS